MISTNLKVLSVKTLFSNKQLKITMLSIWLMFIAPFSSAIESTAELDILPVNGYLLMDYQSGDILAEKNSRLPLEPASITKVMTAYIVYQALANGQIAMSDQMVTSENAYKKIGSKSFLQLKKPYTVEELIYGLVVQSGNDAAVSLAEKVAGTEDAFVALMNEQAGRLGMKETSFTNSTGLPNDDHYTTAYDLGLLAQAMIRDYPEHYKIYSERSYTLEDITQANRNQLLRQTNLQTDAGQRISVDGIKTGHTEAAGYCLLSSAYTDDMRLISVVLGAGSDVQRTSSSLELMQYGFNHFKSSEIFPEDYFVREIRIWKGAAKSVWVGVENVVTAVLPNDRDVALTTNLVLETEAVAPIIKGQKMGFIEIVAEDKVLLTVPLVAMESVPEGGFMRALNDRVFQKTLSLFY